MTKFGGFHLDDDSTRVCCFCEQRFPITELDAKSIKKQKFVCAECAKKETVVKKAAKDTVRKQEQTQKAVEAALKSHEVLSNAAAVCESILDDHGGVKDFTRFWYNQHQIAAQSAPGSKRVLDHFDKVTRLHLLTSQARPPEAETADMTDEEIATEITRIVKEVGLGQPNEQKVKN